MRTRGSLTTLVWKDIREVCMLINMDPLPSEGNHCDDSNCPVKPHIVDWYNRHMITSTILILWQTVIRWVDVPSSGPWNCFSTLWIQQYAPDGYCYLHMGLNTPTEISGSFWWGIWLKKLERPRLPHPQIGWNTKCSCNKYCATQEPTWPAMAIEIIHPTLLPSVFFSWPEKGHSVWMRQMWLGPVCGALLRRIPYQSKFVTHPNCEYCVLWQKSNPRSHRPSAATRIMWVMNFLHNILYTACNSQAKIYYKNRWTFFHGLTNS